MKKIQLVFRLVPIHIFQKFSLAIFPLFLPPVHIITPTFPLYTTLSAHIIQSQSTGFEIRILIIISTCLLFSRSLRKPTWREWEVGNVDFRFVL